MALLLDTHAFLWFIDDDPRRSATAQQRIGDPAERVLVSLVSLWDIVIKLVPFAGTLASPDDPHRREPSLPAAF